MLEIAETFSPPSSFNAASVDDRTDAELDALPFGVIALDRDGFVLRYNLYESRLARLDRNQVVGRNFFDEIAPCTRNEAFQGRFRALVADGGPDGRPDGVLGPDDVLRHVTAWGLQDRRLGEALPIGIRVWRWRDGRIGARRAARVMATPRATR